MFDYPIPPLSRSLYDELGLGPEATSEEINEARQELTARLKFRQKALIRTLDGVYQKVPDLRETWNELKALEKAGTDADPKQYRAAQVKLAALEKKALNVQPDFKAVRDESAIIEGQIHEANLMPIQNPEERLEHDRSHPPFELIKLADCGVSPLDARKTMLNMVRRELIDFFEQTGEEVFHPTDLTRSDFHHDFTTDNTLDRNQ